MAAIEIRIPKEISEYKEKFIFGLTVRQVISLAAALAICIPLYIFGKETIDDELISWLIIILASPILAFGFLQYQGMKAEKALVMLYRFYVQPQKRIYQETPVFWDAKIEIMDDEILHQMAYDTELKEGKKNGVALRTEKKQ